MAIDQAVFVAANASDDQKLHLSNFMSCYMDYETKIGAFRLLTYYLKVILL